MKKILALIFILTMILCSCQEARTMHTETTAATEATEQTDETKTKVKVAKFTEKKAEDIYTNSVAWSSSGGRNLDYSEITPLEYKGEEMVMHIKLNLGTTEEEGMGVYLYVNGFFLPFSMQEYSGEDFSQPLTEESTMDVFHQLIFEPNDNTEKDERYFTVKFNPDMFDKGDVVYPTIVGNVNNTYIPPNKSNISSVATSVFAVFPPTLNINAEKKQSYKVSDKFYNESLPKDFNEENESNVVNLNLTSNKNSGKNYAKVKRGTKLKMTAQAYTKKDDYAEYDDREVILSVIVNDRPVAVFDKNEYQKLSVNKNQYYNRDFTLNTSKLKDINRAQILSCQFGSEDEGNTFLMNSDVFYIEVTD